MTGPTASAPGRTATSALDLNRYVSDTLTAMATEGLSSIADLQKLESLGNRIAGALTAAALLGDIEELERVGASFESSADEIEANRRSATHYVELAAQHAALPGVEAG